MSGGSFFQTLRGLGVSPAGFAGLSVFFSAVTALRPAAPDR